MGRGAGNGGNVNRSKEGDMLPTPTPYLQGSNDSHENNSANQDSKEQHNHSKGARIVQGAARKHPHPLAGPLQNPPTNKHLSRGSFLSHCHWIL